METHAQPQQTVAIVDYHKFRHDVESTVLENLKQEAENLTAKRMYYTTKEVAKIFGKTAQTLNRWHKQGILCYSKVGDENSRFDNLYSIDEVNALHENLRRQREQKSDFQRENLVNHIALVVQA